jgi:N-methylhydantoinase B
MNSGSITPLTLVTQPGTIAHAVQPAGTMLCTVTSTEAVSECIWLALAQAVPDRANAGWSRAFALGTGGVHELTGRPFAVFPSAAGGGGATSGFDGWNAIGNPGFMGGGVDVDVEVIELTTPLTILEYSYEADSAGSGKWRGGTGSVIRWRAEQNDLPVICLGGGSSDETAPFGLEGGGQGRPNRSRIIRANGTVETVIGNSSLRLDRGDVVEVHTSGGGGFGDPLERDSARVAADIRTGLLTPRRAESDYAVVMNREGIVDREATRTQRAKRAGGNTET